MNYQLEEIINKELLLKHALKLLNDDINDEIGQQILSWYLLNELPEDHTEEEFHKQYNLYLARGTLQSLCDKDLLEYNFEDNAYNITALGKKVQKQNESKDKNGKRKR